MTFWKVLRDGWRRVWRTAAWRQAEADRRARLAAQSVNTPELRAHFRTWFAAGLGYDAWRAEMEHVITPRMKAHMEQIEAAGVDPEGMMRAWYEELRRASIS
jgi:hypothetical protein